MNSIPFKINNQEFPYKLSLSFKPLIQYWQTKITDGNKGISRFAQEINRELTQSPALMHNIETSSVLQENEDLIDLLMTAVFPPANWETEISGALIPFQNISFYHTPKFRQIFLTDGYNLKRPLNFDDTTMLTFMKRQAFFVILEKIYNLSIPQEEATIFTVPDYQVGLYRHFNVTLNNRFLQIHKKDGHKLLTEDQIKILLRNLHDTDLWLKHLPPADFEFEGFYIMELVDVTEPEMLSSIKLDLLGKDVLIAADRFEQLQEKIRIFFKKPQLQLGIAAFNKKTKTFVNLSRKINHSILIPNQDSSQNSATFKTIYDKLLKERDPIVLETVQTASLPAEVIEEISRMGIKSIILSLLRYDDDILGIIELGSPVAGDLNSFSLPKIEQFIPHFIAAVKRHSEEQESRIQNVIKDKFTAIHPVLEWRFKEAAQNLLEKQENAKNTEIEPIIFSDVFPLYGVSDVRGSSVERNKAIQNDLIEHLRLIEKVLQKALLLQPLPILDELKFYIYKHLRKLRRGILSEDEAAIFEVIKKHVEPIFQYLRTNTPELAPTVNKYFDAMDPQLGILYKRRKNFEESLTLINETVSDYLEEEEEKAQHMFPHYFEKYKTDGVEFNIYVGSSLIENRTFDLVFLKNLRLWQLMTMCEITRRTQALKSQLTLPLETTQLILLYTQPLSIRFRRDERKFDVDGVHNIRYEIVKKRIDKATVVGTKERLTQPGTIAIVYSQGREANEYKEYIEYLQNIGLLQPEVEDLDLEELQGVSGLKSLRVKVKF